MPRSRGLLGATYPVITHLALNDFTDTGRRIKAQSAEPVNVHRSEQAAINTKPIYPVNSGLVPHYTGHITGTYATACHLRARAALHGAHSRYLRYSMSPQGSYNTTFSTFQIPYPTYIELVPHKVRHPLSYNACGHWD